MARPLEEPDELHWRRLEARLLAKLEAERGEQGHFSVDLGRAPTPPPLEFPRLIEPARGRRWLAAGLVAAAVVTAFVVAAPSFRTRPAKVVAATPEWELLDGSAELRSGSAPMRVELGSGVRIELASGTEVFVARPDQYPPALTLDHGRIHVFEPVAVTDRAEPLLPATPLAAPIRVQTPDLLILASSRNFTVSHEGERPFVEVRSGKAEIPSLGLVVRAGERRELSAAESGELARAERLVKPAPKPRRRARRARRAPAAEPPLPGLGKPAAPPAPPPEPEVDPAEAVAEQPGEMQTFSVEVMEPEEAGAIEAGLARARRAWLLERDAAKAARFAEAVAARPEAGAVIVREALDIACEARVSQGAGKAALRVCARLLDHEPDLERRRRLHFTLATVLRDRMGDCERAVDHYGKALVFGRTGRFDIEVRLRRAECAVELGRAELARADLRRIEEANGWSDRAERVRRRLDNLGSSPHRGPK